MAPGARGAAHDENGAAAGPKISLQAANYLRKLEIPKARGEGTKFLSFSHSYRRIFGG